MNWIDFIVILPAAWFAYKGFKNGLIYELASTLALIIGVWATVSFSSVLAAKLGDNQVYKFIVFVLIFVGVLVAIHFAGKVIEKFIKLLIPGIVNNITGLLFGMLKVVIVCSVFFMFINNVDKKAVIIKPEAKETSLCYKYVEPVAPFLSNWCRKEFDKRKEIKITSEEI